MELRTQGTNNVRNAAGAAGLGFEPGPGPGPGAHPLRRVHDLHPDPLWALPRDPGAVPQATRPGLNRAPRAVDLGRAGFDGSSKFHDAILEDGAGMSPAEPTLGAALRPGRPARGPAGATRGTPGGEGALGGFVPGRTGLAAEAVGVYTEPRSGRRFRVFENSMPPAQGDYRRSTTGARAQFAKMFGGYAPAEPRVSKGEILAAPPVPDAIGHDLTEYHRVAAQRGAQEAAWFGPHADETGLDTADGAKRLTFRYHDPEPLRVAARPDTHVHRWKQPGPAPESGARASVEGAGPRREPRAPLAVRDGLAEAVGRAAMSVLSPDHKLASVWSETGLRPETARVDRAFHRKLGEALLSQAVEPEAERGGVRSEHAAPLSVRDRLAARLGARALLAAASPAATRGHAAADRIDKAVLEATLREPHRLRAAVALGKVMIGAAASGSVAAGGSSAVVRAMRSRVFKTIRETARDYVVQRMAGGAGNPEPRTDGAATTKSARGRVSRFDAMEIPHAPGAEVGSDSAPPLAAVPFGAAGARAPRGGGLGRGGAAQLRFADADRVMVYGNPWDRLDPAEPVA